MTLPRLKGGAAVLAATLTLVTLGGIGGATAARLIDSGDIKDESIRKRDIGPNAVGRSELGPRSVDWSDEINRPTRQRIRGLAAPTAWGRVAGFGTTPTVATSSDNVAAVLRSQDSSGYGPAAGSYCLRFDPPLPAERLGAATVTGFYGPNYPVAVVSTGYCNSGELGVLLFDFATTGTTKNGDFTFFVP